MSTDTREVLSPREVAERAGFSYHAILRAIRRGDLQAFEPVTGHYRIELADYERWLHRPVRRESGPSEPALAERLPRPRKSPSSERGSFARLRAIEES
jgi:excisionase family DNA binding protein